MYHVSDEKTVQILSLHFVPSLYFVSGLQSVVTGLVLLFLFERASSPDRRIGTRKKIFSETVLAAMIDVWAVCWRAPEEKLNDGALITLYQLKTKANARLTNIAASDALLRGHRLWTLRFLDSSCIYGSSEMWLEIIIFNKPYKHLISFHVSFWASSKLILTFTKWGGVACKTTSVDGPQCNFHLRNITYVHGRQLPSTCASPQYLIHCFQHEWAKNEFEKTKPQVGIGHEKVDSLEEVQVSLLVATMCDEIQNMMFKRICPQRFKPNVQRKVKDIEGKRNWAAF